MRYLHLIPRDRPGYGAVLSDLFVGMIINLTLSYNSPGFVRQIYVF